MADIFISYKREDRALVKPLVRALQERGFTVWWDNRIEAGQHWMACIKRALDNARCIVVLWTPRSVASNGIYTSDIVEAEAEEGRKRDILVPITMEDGPFAFPHNIRNAVNLTDWQGTVDDPSFVRLAARLVAYSGERAPADSAELAAWLTAEGANNADAYRQFAREFPRSRFAAEAEPRAAEIELLEADIQLAREAAIRIIDRFSAQVSKPDFAPRLSFGRVERETPIACTAEELFEDLAHGGKAVLSAEPGGGKTVTLLEWAKAFGTSEPERVGIFLRLKEVATTRDNFLSHIARLDATANVSEGAWTALARSGVLTLFCDGWNELSDAEREVIGPILDIYARTYPASGLVVGSRPIAPPPFAGQHLSLLLERLSLEQVRAVIEFQLGAASSQALAELRQSRSLRDLVRTPFFLTAFCKTRAAGDSPTTREGLIRGMIAAGERLPQHAGVLRSALGNQQTKYLSALAVSMLQGQSVELKNDEARQVINQVSESLVHDRILTRAPDAGSVLNVLRDHHCLIEHTGNEPRFRFQHQLISEWYASDEVRRIAALALDDAQARARLDREILDRTAWTEAILFAVERPQEGNDGIVAIAYLILRALGIDPEFAGDLIAVSPPAVWQMIRPSVTAFVNEWRRSAPHRVVRFIQHCGKDDFADIVWSTIGEEKLSNVANALQASRIRHPSILGPQWKQKCAALPTEGRASLLTLLASGGTLEGAAMASSAASIDSEPKVQSEVAEILDFYGFHDEVAELLRVVHPGTWEELVQRRHVHMLLEEPWRKTSLDAAHRVLAGLEPSPYRISFALWLRSQGEKIEMDFVSELLETKFEPGYGEQELYRQVAEIDGERLSAALVSRALEGQRVSHYAARYIDRNTPVDQERVLAACRTQPRFGQRYVLAPLLNAVSLGAVFSELVAVHNEWRENRSNRGALVDRYPVLQDTLTQADRNTLAEIILSLMPSGAMEISEACDVLARAFPQSARDDEREPLRSDLRTCIIERLEAWSNRLMSDANCDRHALHRMAEAIATFPSISLLTPLRAMLSEDLRRWREEQAEFKAVLERGGRPDSGSGARLSYAFRYGQNMLSLAMGRNADEAGMDGDGDQTAPSAEMTAAVTDVLSDFYLDHEFGAEAARVVAKLNPDPILRIGKPRRFVSPDIRVVRERRKARSESGIQPVDPVASRLLVAIDRLRSDGSPEALKLAVELAPAAIRMNCGSQLESIWALVVEHGSLESIGKFMMLRLLLGYDVNGEVAERCLDELDGRRAERSWEYDQNWFRWEELLILMIFGRKPLEAVERLLTYDFRGQHHDERRLVEALGLCGHADALMALDLLKQRCADHHMIDAWWTAVRDVGTVEAGDTLLGLLLKPSGRMDWHSVDRLSAAVARLAEEHESVSKEILRIGACGTADELNGIAGIVRHLNREELIAEFLSLPGDRLERLRDALANALRDVCVEHRGVEGESGVFEMIPRPIPMLRATLFARVSANDIGSALCVSLLQLIDEIREDYGHPAEETRHPDINVDRPWPAAAHRAWDASTQFVKKIAS